MFSPVPGGFLADVSFVQLLSSSDEFFFFFLVGKTTIANDDVEIVGDTFIAKISRFGRPMLMDGHFKGVVSCNSFAVWRVTCFLR